MKKELPIGVSEFSDIRKKDYYYVDKTLLINEWLPSGTAVTLITRPRRFGKTLNMTMLWDFFDITKDSKMMFEGLAVMNTQCAKEMNQWPLIYLSLRDCKGGYRDAMTCIYKKLLSLCTPALQFNSLSEIDKRMLNKVIEIILSFDFEQRAIVQDTIYFLSKLFYQHYGKKVIILLDEYDTPMINAYEEGFYDEIHSFFSVLFGSALKDNPYLERAMVTGIHRIAKESIFSDLNNLEVCTVIDRKYNQYFGLTPKETETLLTCYELDLNDAVSNMYDGYVFGGQEIYSPWSIINYVDKKMMVPYWGHTASNNMVNDAIMNAGTDFKRELEQLLEHNKTQAYVDMETSFLEMSGSDTLWGLLLNTGYLTTTATAEDMFNGAVTLTIPNEEVRKAVFREVLSRYTGIGKIYLDRFYKGLLEKDISSFKAAYSDFIINHTSYFDSSELGYHMLFLGLSFGLEASYNITSNIEHGYGRPDIRLEAKKPGLHNIIIEFKYGEDLEVLAQEALSQIHEKQYYADLNGEVLLLGIAHNKKACAITEELLTI